MSQQEQTAYIAKSEQRLWNIVIAVVLGLGGWWLQSQATQTIHVADQLLAYTRLVDEKYALASRVERLALDVDTKVGIERIKKLEDDVNRLSDKLDRLMERLVLERDKTDAADKLKLK